MFTVISIILLCIHYDKTYKKVFKYENKIAEQAPIPYSINWSRERAMNYALAEIQAMFPMVYIAFIVDFILTIVFS